MPSSTLYTAAQYAALLDAQVGKPYVLGTPVPHDAPNPASFDCSGLPIWANGMGDDTAAGLYNRSKAVTGTPAVGDLVFLRNNPARSNGIGHVAVLTSKLSNGDWRIIEARGRASGVVRTTLSYWKTRAHYAGLRRLPGFKLAPTPAAPAPVPVPVVTAVKVATLNCLDPNIRQGSPPKLHPLTAARRKALVAVVKKAAADIYCLTECPETTRYALRDGMPGGRSRWLVWERGAQALMWDSKRLAHTSPVKLAWGYHGALAATFTVRGTSHKVSVGAFHLPPNSTTSEAKQRSLLADLLARMRKLPGVRIVGGDGMDSASWASGWLDARTAAATSPNRAAPTYQGRSITDRVLSDSLTPVSWATYQVLDAGAGSDHDLVVAGLTITTTATN